MEPTTLVLDENGVISEDVKLFLSDTPEQVELPNRQFVVICIDWNYYGTQRYSINSICASFLQFDQDAQVDLPSLLVGTTKSDVLLPDQKMAIRDWIWNEIQQETNDLSIWKRTFSHVKQFIR